MRILISIILIFIISCEKDIYKNIPFDQINLKSNLSDGKYPGEIIYLDENFRVLQNLQDYKNVWIIIKNKDIVGVEFENMYIPSINTTHPTGKLQIKELQKVRHYKILGDEKEEIYDLDFLEHF